jgi:undecaprenyl diphosphate synthase
MAARYVAIIMDGNARWATERGLPVLAGHREGAKALKRTVRNAVRLDVRELTVYAFSTENWTRPRPEVEGLMAMFAELIQTETPELDEEGVRMRFVGRRDGISDELRERMDWAEGVTAGNERMTLFVAFNYGGRAEIVDAVRRLVAAGTPADKITEAAIAKHLYDPDMPDPDLVVRTSGEFRISNFLLWELAYSELVFTDVLWPDFRREHLFEAVREYQRRERRFGAVDEA